MGDIGCNKCKAPAKLYFHCSNGCALCEPCALNSVAKKCCANCQAYDYGKDVSLKLQIPFVDIGCLVFIGASVFDGVADAENIIHECTFAEYATHTYTAITSCMGGLLMAIMRFDSSNSQSDRREISKIIRKYASFVAVVQASSAALRYIAPLCIPPVASLLLKNSRFIATMSYLTIYAMLYHRRDLAMVSWKCVDLLKQACGGIMHRGYKCLRLAAFIAAHPLTSIVAAYQYVAALFIRGLFRLGDE